MSLKGRLVWQNGGLVVVDDFEDVVGKGLVWGSRWVSLRWALWMNRRLELNRGRRTELPCALHTREIAAAGRNAYSTSILAPIQCSPDG